MNVDPYEAFGTLLEQIEQEAEFPSPDPVNDAIDAVLEGSGVAPISRVPVIKQIVGVAREKLLQRMRESTGALLCGSTGKTSNGRSVEATYETFWAGICGGWIGRPVSPSGIYGYLDTEVVGRFSGFMEQVSVSLGLMPER